MLTEVRARLSNAISGYLPNPLKNKAVRVALPILGLAAAFGAVIYCLRHRIWTTRSVQQMLVPLMPEGFMGFNLKTPPADGRKVYFRDQAPSNPDTVVKITDQVTYPANWVRLSRLHSGIGTSLNYIVAEHPPKVQLLKDYYHLLHNEAGFVISFEEPPFHLIGMGGWYQGEFDLRCESRNEGLLYSVCEYRITQGSEKRTVWHLIFKEFPISASFKEIQACVDLVNAFIEEKNIELKGRPILACCKTGIHQSGLFVLFHQLDHHLELLIRKNLSQPGNRSNEQIADTILKDCHVRIMLQNRGEIIESQSVKAWENQDLTAAMTDNFTDKGQVPDEEINQAYRSHVMAKIQEIRSS